MFAVVTDYTLDLTKSSFSIDSALYTNIQFFPAPVAGVITDQAISYADMVVQYVNDGSGTHDLIEKALKRLNEAKKTLKQQ